LEREHRASPAAGTQARLITDGAVQNKKHKNCLDIHEIFTVNRAMPIRTSYAAFIILLVSVSIRAEEPKLLESSWTELTQEPSRQELFEKIKQASGDQSKAIPIKFFFPNDALFDTIRNEARNEVIFGIDVSHHNEGPLPVAMLREKKVDFVYAKATQGVNFKDPKFSYYWNELEKLKPEQRPLRGAYHFLTALDGGKEQAERFVQYVKLHGGIRKDDMPPCLDLEWDVVSNNPDRWKGQSPDKILGSAVAWLQKTKELTGRTPLVYTAAAWWHERGISDAKFAELKDYPIWIADYSKSGKASEKPAIINGRTQSLWQFADNAKLNAGYPGKLDANIFHGSRDDFNREFGFDR
jgi:lysozyme